MEAAIGKKWNFCVPLFNKFLPRSSVTKLLAKSLLENKGKVRIFSSKNDETGVENIFKGQLEVPPPEWTVTFSTPAI